MACAKFGCSHSAAAACVNNSPPGRMSGGTTRRISSDRPSRPRFDKETNFVHLIRSDKSYRPPPLLARTNCEIDGKMGTLSAVPRFAWEARRLNQNGG